MGMIQRLRDAYPGVKITAFDGHYSPIGDADVAILDHIIVKDGRRTASLDAVESGRRKKPKPAAIEARMARLIGEFEAKGMSA